jgi:hypothetical protein
MDLRAIREAVAERLATVPGVRAFAYPPDQTPTGTAVAVVVAPGENYVQWHESFKGSNKLGMVGLIVTPYVQMSDARSAWATLDELLSTGSAHPRSIVDALLYADDKTLGGVCETVGVDDVTNVQVLTVAEGARYLTADLPVTIYARRS